MIRKPVKLVFMLCIGILCRVIPVHSQPSFITSFNYPSLNLFEYQGRPLPCSDGTFLIFGAGSWLDSSTYHYTNMIAAKLDSNGVLLWSKSYGNNSSAQIWAAVETPSGYIMAGTMMINGVYPETLVLLKINTNGDTLWTRKYQDCGSLFDLKLMSNGDVIGTGYRSGSPGMHPQTIRFDSAGNIVWKKEYEHTPVTGIGGRNGYVCSDGSIIFYFQGSVVTKLDSAGNYLWSLPYHNYHLLEWSNDITEMSDGNYLLVGNYGSSGAEAEGMISKITPSGTLLWAKTIGSNATADYFYSAAPLDDGTIILNGVSYDTGAAINPGNWAVKIDTSGNVLWSKEFNDPGGNYFYGYKVRNCSPGGFISAGFKLPPFGSGEELLIVRSKFDSLLCGLSDGPDSTGYVSDTGITSINVTSLTTPYNEFDTAIYITSNVLVQTDYCITGIAEKPGNTSPLSVYPNPFYDVIHIEMTGEEKIKTVKVYDTLGKLLRNFKYIGFSTPDMHELNAGLYFLYIESTRGLQIEKIVKQ